MTSFREAGGTLLVFKSAAVRKVADYVIVPSSVPMATKFY